MKRKLIYTLAAVAVLILGTAWILYPAQDAEDRVSNDIAGISGDSTPAENASEESLPEENQDTAPAQSTSHVWAEETIEDLISVSLVIEEKTYTADMQTESSVIETMQEIANETELEFETRKFSGIGELVQSINGKKSADGFYWFLYVNGKSAEVGASQYMLQDGDQIEWRYKKME